MIYQITKVIWSRQIALHFSLIIRCFVHVYPLIWLIVFFCIGTLAEKVKEMWCGQSSWQATSGFSLVASYGSTHRLQNNSNKRTERCKQGLLSYCISEVCVCVCVDVSSYYCYLITPSFQICIILFRASFYFFNHQCCCIRSKELSKNTDPICWLPVSRLYSSKLWPFVWSRVKISLIKSFNI